MWIFTEMLTLCCTEMVMGGVSSGAGVWPSIPITKRESITYLRGVVQSDKQHVSCRLRGFWQRGDWGACGGGMYSGTWCIEVLGLRVKRQTRVKTFGQSQCL